MCLKREIHHVLNSYLYTGASEDNSKALIFGLWELRFHHA